MQAVILAAGQSSRFYPLSNGFHKSMIRIMSKPILEYTIEGLKKLNLKDLIIVEDSKKIISSYFGDGKKFGVSIRYAVQKEPLGAGNALLGIKELIKGDFLLLNPSHIDIENFVKKIIKNKTKNDGGVLLIKRKENTWDHGVAEVSDGKLSNLIEKPEKGKEPSRFCQIGIYLFSIDFLRRLEETPAEHYQLEAAISSFAKTNSIKVVETNKDTITLKYPWNLLMVKDFIFKSLKRSISKKAVIAKTAIIEGNVAVMDNAKIMDGVKITGPCYIGKNAFVGNNAVLRNGVVIEENSVAGAFSEVKNSIIMRNSKTHSGFIGDSVIGENCRVGAQFCTSNVRLDRDTVKTIVNNKKTDTGLKSLGFVCGNNVKIGIKSTTMPGVIIGNNAVIGPSTTVLENVGDNMKYFSKIQGIAIKK